MDKTLKSKAISIKGKSYVQVKDRIIFFNENYPNGSIQTKMWSRGDIIRVKAYVIPDVSNEHRVFNGFSESVRGGEGVDKTSAIENCETSAVGRALAMMGIGVLDSVASADELRKAGVSDNEPASEKQINYINNLCTNRALLPDVVLKRMGITEPEKMTKTQARDVINKLLATGNETEKA
jgi:hypothetical protein